MKHDLPAIISKEEFIIVKEKIDSNKRPGQPYKAKEVYLLSGKIFCEECGSNFVGNSHYSGRNKNLHVTYRCTARSSKRTCSNKEIRREYIETFVLDMLSKYVFNDKLIPKLIKAYSKYKYLKNSELVDKEKKIRKRLHSIKTEINNLLILASKVAGSEALAQKLTDLESEKVILEAKSTKLSAENELNTLTEQDLIYSFNQAKSLLAYGKLPMTEKLIELYVECVTVGINDVKVFFKAHPDLIVPEIEKVKLSTGEKVYKGALEFSKKKLPAL